MLCVVCVFVVCMFEGVFVALVCLRGVVEWSFVCFCVCLCFVCCVLLLFVIVCVVVVVECLCCGYVLFIVCACFVFGFDYVVVQLLLS